MSNNPREVLPQNPNMILLLLLNGRTSDLIVIQLVARFCFAFFPQRRFFVHLNNNISLFLRHLIALLQIVSSSFDVFCAVSAQIFNNLFLMTLTTELNWFLSTALINSSFCSVSISAVVFYGELLFFRCLRFSISSACFLIYKATVAASHNLRDFSFVVK